MNMGILASVQNQIQPLMNFQTAINISPFFLRKEKVVFIGGPTGTGKSKLAIDLATKIPAEVINCDKMQVYKGLEIVTNKVTEYDCRGVPHHLLSIIDPNANFTANDFRHHATTAVESIIARDRLPIIAGGSNSFIEALASDDNKFRARYEFCFIWVDVALPILHSFVSKRVDRMVKAGLVNEVRNLFDPKKGYSQGIRRAIGVSELDNYFRNERKVDKKTRGKLLDLAIENIKKNTCSLACRQLEKFYRLYNRWSWKIHRIDATEVFLKNGEEADEAWEKLVAEPSSLIVEQFLYDEDQIQKIIPPELITGMATPIPAIMAAAATR